MGTKASLKSIRQHIDAKEFEKAQEIIEDLLKQDVSDYLLFIFAAITSAELGNDTEAINFYKKATELDAKKSLAWQGLYKMYEQEKYDDLEHVLVVIENLLHVPEIAAEKALAYARARSFILLKLKKYDDAFSNLDRLDDDVEFCDAALKAVLYADNWDGNRKGIVEKCLTKIDAGKLDSTIHRKCAELRCCWVKTLEEILEILAWHMKYMSVGDKWLTEFLRYFVIISYLEQRKVDTSNSTIDMLKDAIANETEFEILLGHIQKAEQPAAIKNIDGNLEENKCKWPYIGLAVPVLLAQERYEQVLSLLNLPILSVHPTITERVMEAVTVARCEALYGIHDNDSLEELRLLLTKNSSSSRLYRNIRLAMICENAELDDVMKFEMLQKEQFDKAGEEQYWKAVIMKNSKDAESLREAKNLAENAAKSDPQSWQRLLLFAEICLKLDAQDPAATSTLVKGAKINPYSSRVFFYLGKSLTTKNRAKAISCLERAMKIRPQNAEVAKLLDELLGLEGRKDEQLQHMRQFSKTVPNLSWARKRLALLEMEAGNIDAAIDQMQHIVVLDRNDAVIWTALADAYRKRGNYQSAIRAYKEAIDLKPADDVAQIQFIKMSQLTGQCEEAIEQCVELEKRVESGQSIADCVYLLHAESLLKLAQKSAYSQQFALLNQFFGLIGKVFVQNSEFILRYKLAADALLLASRFHADTFKHFEFPETWKIERSVDAAELAIRFYCILVKVRPNCSSFWNDLGVALLRKCQQTKDNSGCANAIECFKRAIKLCKSKTTKSMYWTNLSEAIALTQNALIMQHCLIRAVQLSLRNDTAWFLLGLLYLQYNKIDLARQAFNMAQKINPDSGENWCALATMAEAENHYDTMDLYRHSLTLKPTELAVKKYTYYVMKMLSERKHCDNATMFDFESVHEIIGVSNRSDELIFFISLLAEHFWYMDYAVHYISCCHDWPSEDICKLHKQRIAVRSGNQELSEKAGTNQYLSTLYSSTTEEIYEKLLRECPIYAQLFTALEQNNVKRFRAILLDSKNKIQFPLLIAAIICFQKKLNDDFICVLDDVRPRHQLALVFPPDRQQDVDSEFAYDILEELGEKTIVRYDNMSKRLCELLAQRGEQYRSSRVVEKPQIEEEF